MSKKTIFHAILLKEIIKLQKLCWLPFIVGVAIAADLYTTYKGFVSSHSAADLWAMLIFKQSIHFDKFQWLLVGGGIWFACLQFIPECKNKRLKLMFHLPVPYRLSIYSIVGIGLFLNLILSLTALFCLFLVFNALHLPCELSFAMLISVIPWSIAGAVSYLAAVSVIAETSIVRKLALTFAGVIFITLLLTTNGFFSFKSDLWLYTLASSLWLFAVNASVLRIKDKH